MKTTRIAALAALFAISLATVALGLSTVRVIAGGQPHNVRAVQVGGAWYLNATDLATALGGGASYDASKRMFIASTADRNSLLHTVDRVGGSFATDGTVAARLVSVKTETSFQGNAPDPGAHFVFAVMQLKNLSKDPVPMYQVQTSMVAGSTHLNDGQFYDTKGNDLADTDVAPGQMVTYLDVFEINDGVAADAILVHPPFAPTSAPIDMLLKL
jgi:hypothetical protein